MKSGNQILTIVSGASFPAFMGYGSGLAILVFAFDYTGARWTGFKRDPDVDEVDRKEWIRNNKRRPLSETIYELGEGRGTFLKTIW